MCLLAALSDIRAESANYIKKNEDETVSARVTDASLSYIADFFLNNYGIVFSGKEDLSMNLVSVSFNDKPVADALKKMFDQINIIFVYNARGSIVEVTLLDSSQRKFASESTVSNFPSSINLSSAGFSVDSKIQDEITAFKPKKIAPGKDQQNFFADDDITSFKPQKNFPPSPE